MKKTLMILLSLIILSASVFAGGQQEAADADEAGKFKIAFIYKVYVCNDLFF